MKLLFQTFLCGVFSVNFAQASQYKWKEFSFKMDVPSTWQSANDFMGVPLTLFAPMMSGTDRRVVVQVMPTQAKPLVFNDKEMKAFDKNYAARRKKWIQKRNGKLKEIESVKIDIVGGQKAFVAGSTYNWVLRNFKEKTYYLNCGKTLYHLKLVGDPAKKDELDKAEKVLRSFRCE